MELEVIFFGGGGYFSQNYNFQTFLNFFLEFEYQVFEYFKDFKFILEGFYAFILLLRKIFLETCLNKGKCLVN